MQQVAESFHCLPRIRSTHPVSFCSDTLLCPHSQPPWVGSTTASCKATSWQWQQYLPDPPSLKAPPPWSRLHKSLSPRDAGEVYLCPSPASYFQFLMASRLQQVPCTMSFSPASQPHPLCTPNDISALQPFELEGSASHLPPPSNRECLSNPQV